MDIEFYDPPERIQVCLTCPLDCKYCDGGDRNGSDRCAYIRQQQNPTRRMKAVVQREIKLETYTVEGCIRAGYNDRKIARMFYMTMDEVTRRRQL